MVRGLLAQLGRGLALGVLDVLLHKRDAEHLRVLLFLRARARELHGGEPDVQKRIVLLERARLALVCVFSGDVGTVDRELL